MINLICLGARTSRRPTTHDQSLRLCLAATTLARDGSTASASSQVKKRTPNTLHLYSRATTRRKATPLRLLYRAMRCNRRFRRLSSPKTTSRSSRSSRSLEIDFRLTVDCANSLIALARSRTTLQARATPWYCYHHPLPRKLERFRLPYCLCTSTRERFQSRTRRLDCVSPNTRGARASTFSALPECARHRQVDSFVTAVCRANARRAR